MTKLEEAIEQFEEGVDDKALHQEISHLMFDIFDCLKSSGHFEDLYYLKNSGPEFVEYEISQTSRSEQYYVSWLKSELSTRYEYDSNGNMILLVDPDGSECRWEYDSNGNKTLEVYPDGLEVSTLTSYYDNGQLKSIGELKIPQF